MKNHPRKLLLLTAAVFALAAPAASAAPESKSATSGQVSATVEWDQTDSRGARNVRVSITRAGTEVMKDERVQPGCRSFCNVPPADQPIRVRDLNGDGEPEVLLDLYTGGAHCCLILDVYRFDAANNRYERLRTNFGNAGYVLRQLGGGLPELTTTDDRFSYLYTSYLESARPLLIYQYNRQGELVDATRHFRGQIRRHRKSMFSLYKRMKREDGLDVRGVLAAWQADNYLLGRKAAAKGWKKLRKASRRGELRKTRTNSGPSGKAYLRSLRKNLKKFGYVG